MIDPKQFALAVAGLHDLIAQEPQLSDFLPAARELREQAEQFANGHLAIPPLSVPTRVGVIPDRELAELLMAAIARVPTIDGDEDAQVMRAVGQLLGNLVDGIMHAIFAGYPDVVPREPSSD